MAGGTSWQQHVEKSKDRGLLAKQLYAVMWSPTGGAEAMAKVLPIHLEYQLKLEASGVLFAAGPLADDNEQEMSGDSLVILRAESLAEAKKIAENDPMFTNGAKSFRVRPWLVNEGGVTVKVTYSDGGREVI